MSCRPTLTPTGQLSRAATAARPASCLWSSACPGRLALARVAPGPDRTQELSLCLLPTCGPDLRQSAGALLLKEGFTFERFETYGFVYVRSIDPYDSGHDPGQAWGKEYLGVRGGQQAVETCE